MRPGPGGVRTACRRRAGCARVRDAAELLVDAVYGQWMRAPSGIHLQFLSISINFGAKLCSVHILLVIFVILHKKNEHLFGRVQFG